MDGSLRVSLRIPRWGPLSGDSKQVFHRRLAGLREDQGPREALSRDMAERDLVREAVLPVAEVFFSR